MDIQAFIQEKIFGNVKKFSDLTVPLFGDWTGLRSGPMTWVTGKAMHNPHVADLRITADSVQVYFASVDLKVAEFDLTGSFLVDFTQHAYGNGSSEVNCYLRHPMEKNYRIAFKTIWPTLAVRSDVPHGRDTLAIVSPFDVSRVIQNLKDHSGVYGVGWNHFVNGGVVDNSLRHLRYKGPVIPDPGIWQRHFLDPGAKVATVSPLDGH